MVRTRLNMVFFWHSRASNSKVESPIWPKFKHVPDFMDVLITCIFEDDPVQIEGLSYGQIFSIISLREKYSSLKGN